MRILVDTDVLLDVALGREAFVGPSAQVLRWCERGGAGAVAGHSMATVAYQLKGDGRAFLTGLLDVVTVAPVGHAEAVGALRLAVPDVEDALHAAAAQAWRADRIVTRNLRHYGRSPIPACVPRDFLAEVER